MLKHYFLVVIGYSNILHAELMVLYHGLRMTWELGIKDLMFIPTITQLSSLSHSMLMFDIIMP